jgi:hypothetical protein
MASADDTHVWTVPVSPAVAALSTRDCTALVKGSDFARRMRAQDPEHGARLCDHGRLLFQPCGLCKDGVPAMPNPSLEEQRESAKAWL